MLPPVRVWTREEMLERVARFADLKGFADGLQDSALPECQKTVYNVLGFQTPREAGMGGVNSPVGQRASANAAIKISEGFNLGFVRCKPGRGVLMHNHDTNETFVVVSGTWRVQWNDAPATESLDVGPLDVISFPAGCARRFENVTPGDPDVDHMLLFVVGGNEPQNEFTPASMKRVEEFAGTGGGAASGRQAAGEAPGDEEDPRRDERHRDQQRDQSHQASGTDGERDGRRAKRARN